MGVRFLVVFLILAPLLLMAQTGASGSLSQVELEPRYETAATVDIIVIVVDQKQVAKGSPLNGSHLIVKPETAKSENDCIDVYLGPADYLKDFEVRFSKGDRLQVVGAKVKFGGGTMVLAREVRRDTTTLYLRDAKGAPYWRKT